MECHGSIAHLEHQLSGQKGAVDAIPTWDGPVASPPNIWKLTDTDDDGVADRREVIVKQFGSTELAKKAAGAKRRLDSVGRSISLRGRTLDGRSVDLAKYRGKVVLLHYWATWCEPCKADLKRIKALQAKFGGVIVLKGAGSLIAGAGEVSVSVCDRGNPGMATAGMGDVLSGVIGALLVTQVARRPAAIVAIRRLIKPKLIH